MVDLSKGLSVEELNRLTARRDSRKFLNPSNELYRQMGMKTNPPSRAEAVRLMSGNPNPNGRPILVRGSKVLPGFREEERREA